MLQAPAVVFLLAIFSAHAHAEPGANQNFTEDGAFVAVAEVGPPPQDVGEELKTWDRIKRSNDVSELEALIARHKDTFFANIARRRIAQLDRQGVVRPGMVQAPN